MNHTLDNLTQAEISAYFANRTPNIDQAGDEWRGPCPIHHGSDPNFAINPASGLWFCHSQCGRGGSILHLEVELTGAEFDVATNAISDIIGRPRTKVASKGRIVATYDYKDDDGVLLHQTVRFEPKEFRQRRPDGKGGWVWNLQGIEPILYRLNEIVSSEVVLIAEGEKDIDALVALGFTATCNPMGAGKWRQNYSDILVGKDVVIFPDNDEPGMAHARAVAHSLSGKAKSIRIVSVEQGKDVSDWIAAGASLETIQAAIDAAEPFVTDPTETREPGKNEIPRGFRVDDDGVFYREPDPDNEDPEIFICSKIEVVAQTRNSDGEEWGRLTRWNDPEGKEHQWAIPMSMFAGNSTDVRANLMHGGLFVSSNRRARELFDRYVLSVKPSKRMRCVSKVGWHGDVFVFPDATIGPDDSEDVIYQSTGIEHQYNTSGSVEDWRKLIGEPCIGNSRLVLAVSAAFAAPLLDPLGIESGGLHFRGGTSIGKTTALVVAGTVWGGGSKGYVRSWRTTDNGLESTAAAHNDALLLLDEMGQAEPRDVGKIAYLLVNGQAKGRMTKAVGPRRNMVWRLIFISSGEISMKEHLASAGIRVKGGQEIRLLDIEADAGAGLGIFENIHEHGKPGAFADALKTASRKAYGTAAREFIRWLVANNDSIAKASAYVTDLSGRLVPQHAASEVGRAAARFALIAAAGELATEAGITGWPKGTPEEAATRCFKDWLAKRGTTGSIDTQEGVERVRSFIQANGASRFQLVVPRKDSQLQSIPERIHDRAGFRDEGKDGATYYILTKTFQDEICAGHDYRAVAKALQLKGFLIHDNDGHLTTQRRLPEVGKIRVYAVSHTICERE